MPLSAPAPIILLGPALEQLALSNWTIRTSTMANSINAIAFSPTFNRWAFIGSGIGNTFSSEDGVTWTQRTNLNVNLFGLTWGNGLFVSVGGPAGTTNISTSPDGVTTYTNRSATAGAPADRVLARVVWTGNKFIAIGTASTRNSLDGINWTVRDAAQGNNALGFGGAVALRDQSGAGDAIARSNDDGDTWSIIVTPNIGVVRGFAFGNDRWVAVGSGGVMTSIDGGSTWLKTNSTLDLTDVAWTGLRFVAVGLLGRVASSADGVVWVEHTGATSLTMNAVAHGRNFSAFVGASGVIRTSLALDF